MWWNPDGSGDELLNPRSVPRRGGTLDGLREIVASLEEPLVLEGLNLSATRSGPLTKEVLVSRLGRLDGAVEHSRNAVLKYYAKSKPLSKVRGFDLARRGVSSHWNMSAHEVGRMAF